MTLTPTVRPQDLRDLLNPWQRDFPLLREPFAAIAAASGRSVTDVLASYGQLQAAGVLSRIGGVFAAGAGGAALLCAMAVPAERLHEVAATVSAHPGVNHNYAREHVYNLWFVLTGMDAMAVEQALQLLECHTGLAALRLPMVKPYRIDLGFDLYGSTANDLPCRCSSPRHAPAIQGQDTALAACVEEGLPLLPRPFDAWAQAVNRRPEQVLATLQEWLQAGCLRRFGTIVRHHELGFAANAMTVFDVPDDQVDACGQALAAQTGVTLAYRRERDREWPYNLYCMVHGTGRAAVREVLDRVIPASGLTARPHAVLFSSRRFKQTGARYFRPVPVGEAHAVV
jgi:siroheme decarboxylase